MKDVDPSKILLRGAQSMEQYMEGEMDRDAALTIWKPKDWATIMEHLLVSKHLISKTLI